MSAKLNTYTGKLTYKQIEFSFVFDGEVLKLIPPEDKRKEVEMWFMKPLQNGAYTIGNPIYVEDEYLIGKCNETCHKIIFLPKRENINKNSSILIVKIKAYVIQKYEREWIDTLGFVSQALDYIYPTTQALELPEWLDDGAVAIKTKDFDTTTSHEQRFLVEEKNISVYFGISKTSCVGIGESPLKLHSKMFFEFEKTKDYAFILRLCHIARCFIQYLCYRKNVNLSEVEIYAPDRNGNHERFGTLYIADDAEDNELEILAKGKYIKQKYICGAEGKILNDIAKDRIYLRHLPETYRGGRNINAARFVMITAAFEWTFNKNYPDGIPKNSKTTEAEDTAVKELDSLIEKSPRTLKNIYKYLKKRIKDRDSLQSKIEQVGKDYAEIVDIFGKPLYKINGQTLIYSKMGLRLSQQRNNFAHGNLDKEFIGLALLDLVYLEYIVYAMQLKEYGVEPKSIQQAIKDLFG